MAKTFGKEKDFGSVEVGKIADLSIIEGDPLQDIWMTQNVKSVVMGGKVIDIAFSRYKNPIPSFYAYLTLPPDIDVSPLLITERTGPTVLKVRGKGMLPNHRVWFNGQPLPTRCVANNELEATIAPEAVPQPGTYVVTVRVEGEPLAESNRAHVVVGFAN